MPVRLKASAKFEWIECGGLPVAHVASFGGVAYILTCPLCSCCHELRGQTFTRKGQKRVVKPRCLLREFATSSKAAPWHGLYADWLKKHPAAAQHTEVRALYIGQGASLTAPYEGTLPHAPAPAESMVAIARQREIDKLAAKAKRAQKWEQASAARKAKAKAKQAA